MKLKIGGRVVTNADVRPTRFANKTGTIVSFKEGEFGVTFSPKFDLARSTINAWFIESELAPVKVVETADLPPLADSTPKGRLISVIVPLERRMRPKSVIRPGDLVRVASTSRTGIVTALTPDRAVVRFGAVRCVTVPRADVVRLSRGAR